VPLLPIFNISFIVSFYGLVLTFAGVLWVINKAIILAK